MGACVGVCASSWVCHYRRISLLKSHASMTLCVVWCFIKMLMWVSILKTRFRLFGHCIMTYIYRFIMRSGDNGLLDILRVCR
jgi:hypothetical protein